MTAPLRTLKRISTKLMFHPLTMFMFQPENVMLLNNKSGVVKLIDFGLSRKILPGTEVKEFIIIIKNKRFRLQ